MSITPLTGSDTFQTWFNRTNSLITEINGITVHNIIGATGIGTTLSSNILTIQNTGVVSLTGSTGISVSGSTGSVTINNTGVWSVNGQNGAVILTGLTGDRVNTFNGLTGGVTGVARIIAGTGITTSGSATVTITNAGVLTFNGSSGTVTGVGTFNGLTGAVSGVTTSVANTFTALQSYASGISVSGQLSLRNIPGILSIISPSSTSIGLISNSSGTTASFLYDGSASNVAIGVGSFDNSNSLDSIGIGENTLKNSTGTQNIAIGKNSMSAGANGSANIAIGINALTTADGTNNISIGNTSVDVLETGNNNVGIGGEALGSLITGDDNVGIGYQALSNNTSSRNTTIGTQAMTQNNTGADNVAVGHMALRAKSVGNNNVAVGKDAGRYRTATGTSTNTGATGSIYIGYDSRASASNNINEIVIGSSAVGMGSNTSVLGTTLHTAAHIYGVVNTPNGITTSGITLNGNLTTNSTTINLVDTVATTVNVARNATEIQIGSLTGNTRIRNNLIVSGGVTLGNFTTDIIYLPNKQKIRTTEATLTTNNANQGIVVLNKNEYSKVDCLLQAERGGTLSGTDSLKTSRILALINKDTNGITFTEYASRFLGTDFVTFGVTLSGSNLVITASPSGLDINNQATIKGIVFGDIGIYNAI